MTPQDKRYNEYRVECAKVDEHKWNPYISVKSEPNTARYCVVKTDDGKIHIAHRARDLSGEEQPAFEGWFEPKLEGYNSFYPVDGTVTDWAELPTYLDDASIDAVVRKLDVDKAYFYTTTLIELCRGDYDEAYGGFKFGGWWIITATPEQKSEALCRTLIVGDK